MIFPSKIDPVVLVALAVGPLVAFSTASAGFARHEPAVGWIGLAVGALVLGLYVVAVFPVRYTTADHELVIRHGLQTQRIPYAEVTAVEPCRSTLAAPALSLDRLIVRRQGRPPTFVSPRNAAGFLAELAARAEGLDLQDGRLVRAGDGRPG